MSHTTNANLKDLLRQELITRYSLNPTDPWLLSFLSTITRPPPVPALTSTAHFRLLTTDFRTSLLPRSPHIFPRDIGNVEVKNVTLPNDIPVQVLEIIDTSTSRYTQIEAIERIERGEEVRGREVIRNVPGVTTTTDGGGGDEDSEVDTGNQGRRQTQGQMQRSNARAAGNNSSSTTTTTMNGNNGTKRGSTGPHKLLLQDAAGTTVWAFELTRIDRITIVTNGPSAPGSTMPVQVEGMQIGCKLLLKSGTNVRRGMVMLTPGNTVVMGGKVEEWDGKWREGRKGVLQRELDGAGSENGT